MTSIDKAALKGELVAVLAAALDAAQLAHAAALQGATHAEARPENSKDTRGLEQSYLARGQAQRVAELAAAVGQVSALALRRFTSADPIAVGAVVVLRGDDAQTIFIAPHGGGTMLAGVQVVTPQSPLGRAVLGKLAGDEIEVRLPGGTRSFEIVSVE